MGFWNDLKNSVVEGVKNGAAKGVMHASGYDSNTGVIQNAAYNYDANGNITGINQKYASDIAKLYSRGYDKNGVFGAVSGLGSSTSEEIPLKLGTNYNSNSKWGKAPLNTGGPNAEQAVTSPERYSTSSDRFKLKLPDWGYDDFINERAMWQKGLSSIFDEPAWFYFKVIFDFESSTGLFGSLLNEGTSQLRNNSALTYLRSCMGLYKYEKIQHRITALYKFASILSYITTNAPWYFKDVKGLDKAAMPIVKEFSQEKSIELGLNADAIDMRLSTLMSLYQYACFDKINGKEIIPQNLRLFNMTVILFQTPLRYLHTSYSSNKKSVVPGIKSSKLNKYAEKLNLDSLKIINNDKLESNTLGTLRKSYKRMTYLNNGRTNYSDMMSMKIFTFEGCEFDPSSFAAVIPGTVTNEMPFKIGETSLKITYTRCLEHTMNEFYGMMFGTDGFYFNNYATYQSLYGNADDYNATEFGYWNKQLERYDTLAKNFEDIIGGGSSFGIPKSRKFQQAVDATEAIMGGIINDSDILNKIGTNALMKLLGRSWDASSTQGNLYGSNVGIGSDYWKEKVNKIKSSDHEYTAKPHKYDPKKDFDLQKYINKFKKTSSFGGGGSRTNK
jgi:hypothetical protein